MSKWINTNSVSIAIQLRKESVSLLIQYKATLLYEDKTFSFYTFRERSACRALQQVQLSSSIYAHLILLTYLILCFIYLCYIHFFADTFEIQLPGLVLCIIYKIYYQKYTDYTVGPAQNEAGKQRDKGIQETQKYSERNGQKGQ